MGKSKIDMKYSNLIAAGTFDNLHKGHEAYLTYAFSLSEHVYIAITSDSYTAVHKPSVAPLAQREKRVKDFLLAKHAMAKATIVPIDDVYGIALRKDLHLDGILVTEKTRKGGELVNKKRKELGLNELPIEIAPLSKTQDNLPISSSLIRSGKIDRSGTLLIDPIWTTKTHILPQTLRERFHKPFGVLVEDIPELPEGKIVTVGDVTTKRFLDTGKKPILSLIDFVVERKQTFSSPADLGFTGKEHILPVANPAGMLTKQVWEVLQKAVALVLEGKQTVVIVTGEEDLCVLPLILSLPLGFHIFYGQPQQALVWVEITQAIKKEVYTLLQKFL